MGFILLLSVDIFLYIQEIQILKILLFIIILVYLILLQPEIGINLKDILFLFMKMFTIGLFIICNNMEEGNV